MKMEQSQPDSHSGSTLGSLGFRLFCPHILDGPDTGFRQAGLHLRQSGFVQESAEFFEDRTVTDNHFHDAVFDSASRAAASQFRTDDPFPFGIEFFGC